MANVGNNYETEKYKWKIWGVLSEEAKKKKSKEEK